MTQSNNRSRGRKNRGRKQSNLKAKRQSPTDSLSIKEMPEAEPSLCQKNSSTGGVQVACEKYAAECTLDEGPLDTMSSQYATGSTNIDEPNMKVYPDDVTSDGVSRAMDPREGYSKGTVKSVETHTDSDSDDDDIYSGNGQSMSEERRDINEDPSSNHHQATNGVSHTKDITDGSDPGDIQTKAQVTLGDTTSSKETRSATQVDSHKSRGPWHTWAKDKKQQRKLVMRRNLGNSRQLRMVFGTFAFQLVNLIYATWIKQICIIWCLRVVKFILIRIQISLERKKLLKARLWDRILNGWVILPTLSPPTYTKSYAQRWCRLWHLPYREHSRRKCVHT